MHNTEHSELLATFKTLVAENKSYESRLEEYARIINNRDNEIKMLQSMLSEANEYRSTLDREVKELKDLKHSISDIKRQSAHSTYMVTGKQQMAVDRINLEAQFDNLKRDYSLMQSEIADMQLQLLAVNSKNILLTLQATRVAELESVLANFEQANNASGS